MGSLMNNKNVSLSPTNDLFAMTEPTEEFRRFADVAFDIHGFANVVSFFSH